MDQQVKSSPFQARIHYSVNELDDCMIGRWRALEERAFERNVYMSPDFVIPALMYLTPEVVPVIVTVEEFDGERPRMIALGVFEPKKSGYCFPFPFLRAYRSKHSFLSGVLLDECKPAYAMAILLSCIKESGKWCAVQFDWRPAERSGEKAVNEVLRENNIRWHQSETWSRAILIPGESGDVYLSKVLSKRTKKTFSRRSRQLKRLGKLEWRFIRGGDFVLEAARNFVRLENIGWKRRKHSSIASREGDMKFFMSVVANFASRRGVFFTEFSLDGEVISSTCNFVSRDAGFAFKLGWDERYAKQGLGMLSEYELVKRAPDVIPDLKYVDSGTLPGSYLEKLWCEKRVLVSGFYSLRPEAAIYLLLVGILRHIRNVGLRTIIVLVLLFALASLNY